MHVLFQNVLNVCDEVKNQISPYLCGLLFYEGRKTCSAMARGLSVSVKQFYNSFTNACEKIASIRDSLKSSANKMVVANELRVFVIDGTSLVKAFAKKIDHLSVDYDGVTRRVAQGLSLMVASLITSGNVVHLDFLFWLNKKSKKTEKRKRKTKIKTNSMYKTKIDLAIDLILAWKNLVLFHYIALDGAFASEKMISFFGREKLNYSMRIPRSRVVTINGITAKLCNHPALRLVRNGRYASASGFYKNHACFFTVEKRKKRNGAWEKIYIVSNMNLSAKDHAKAYARRWSIDKSFRTLKQYFGLKDCQMLKGDRQRLHIFNAFLAYSLATAEKIAKGKKSVEEVLKEWRRSKKIQKISESVD